MSESRPIRLLLVEDNPGDVDLTREALEAGPRRFEISIAADGPAALARLEGEPPYARDKLPDLILLDLNLPKMNGQRVLARIRQTEALRQIPVVILTSSAAHQDVISSYAFGASCYVTKPIGLDAFRSAVRAVETFWFSVARLP